LRDQTVLHSWVTQPWDDYCDLIERDSTWTDILCLIGVAEFFGVRIIILSSLEEKRFITEIGPYVYKKKKPLLLSHWGDFNYGTIEPWSEGTLFKPQSPSHTRQLSVDALPLSPRDSTVSVSKFAADVSISEIQNLFRRRKSFSDMYEKNKRNRTSTAPPTISKENSRISIIDTNDPLLTDLNSLLEYNKMIKSIEAEGIIKTRLLARTAVCLPLSQPTLPKDIHFTPQKKTKKKVNKGKIHRELSGEDIVRTLDFDGEVIEKHWSDSEETVESIEAKETKSEKKKKKKSKKDSNKLSI